MPQEGKGEGPRARHSRSLLVQHTVLLQRAPLLGPQVPIANGLTLQKHALFSLLSHSEQRQTGSLCPLFLQGLVEEIHLNVFRSTSAYPQLIDTLGKLRKCNTGNYCDWKSNCSNHVFDIIFFLVIS
jgi:hypothetical protein